MWACTYVEEEAEHAPWVCCADTQSLQHPTAEITSVTQLKLILTHLQRVPIDARLRLALAARATSAREDATSSTRKKFRAPLALHSRLPLPAPAVSALI